MRLEIDSFLNSEKNKSLSESSRKNYQYALGTFAGWAESEQIKAFDASIQERLGDYTDHLRAIGKSATTIRHYIGILKQLAKHNGFTIDYTYHVSSAEKKAKQAKELDRWFNEEEVDQMKHYAFPKDDLMRGVRNQIMVRLLFETGARIQEIARLLKRDIDLDNQTVWLRTSKTVPRPAFFSGPTRLLIEGYFEMSNLRDSAAVFPKVGQCQNVFCGMLQDLGMKNGQDGRGPHTARHYVATYLYYVGGMELFDIATLLGDKVETIMNVYLHPTPKMLFGRVKRAMGWE